MKNFKNWSSGIGNWSSDTHGFSLIELIFAMFFLVIIILGVVSLQTSNLSMINRQNNEIRAHFYVNQALEIASVLPHSLNNGDFIINFKRANYTLASTVEVNGDLIPETDFYRKIEVDNTGLIPPAFRVTAVIYWEDGTGEHTIKAKRIIP